MADQVRGGTISFVVDGTRYDAKGNFTFNLGYPKRESIVGADGVHGYKEVPQEAMIEGEITDSTAVVLSALVQLADSTVTLTLATGKVIQIAAAWYAGEGTGNTEEGNFPVKFVGKKGQEIIS
jgi:hypothetical protein